MENSNTLTKSLELIIDNLNDENFLKNNFKAFCTNHSYNFMFTANEEDIFPIHSILLIEKEETHLDMLEDTLMTILLNQLNNLIEQLELEYPQKLTIYAPVIDVISIEDDERYTDEMREKYKAIRLEVLTNIYMKVE